MARFSPIQGDFSSGEFSPLLVGQVENPAYKKGLALSQNMIPMLQGPVTRRAGTKYVANATNGGNASTRLIPFKYSTTQDYMLEFGQNYIVFYTNRAQIQVPNGYGFVCSPATASVGATYTDSNSNTFTLFYGASGATTIVAQSTSGGNPAPAASGTLTKTSGTGDATITYTAVAFPYRYFINTPYQYADLADLKYCQSLDVLYLVHPNYPPATLSRYGNELWVYNPIIFNDGPYLDEGLYPKNRVVVNSEGYSGLTVTGTSTSPGDSVTVDTSGFISGAGANIASVANNGSGQFRITLATSVPQNIFGDNSNVWVVSGTGATGVNGSYTVRQISARVYDLLGSTYGAGYNANSAGAFPGPFLAGDEGRMLRIGAFDGTTAQTFWAYLLITAVADYSSCTATIIDMSANLTTGFSAATTYFAFGAYNPNDGYPSCCCFHEDRLYLGAPGVDLSRLDGSTVSNYINFAPSLMLDGTVTAACAVSFSLNSHDGNAITAMKSDELGMPVLTTGGPWVVRPSILSEAISPTNISAKKVNNTGSASIDAVSSAKATIFLNLSTRKVFELSYFYQTGSFRSIDLTEIAEHLPGTGITTELTYAQNPIPTLWFGTANGTLISVTYDRQLEQLRCGWARHYLGGESDTSGTPPIVLSLATIPSPDGTSDDVWMVVNRLVNGSQVQYIEYMTRIFQSFDEPENAFFSDCGASYNVSQTFSAISNTNPANVVSTAHGHNTGDQVRFYDVEGLLDANGNNTINNIPFTITKVDSNNFTLNGYNSTSYTAYDPGVGNSSYNKLVTTISGISWLIGQSVSILADGFVLPQAIVSSGGSLTLSTPAGVVNFGLPITAKLKQLVVEGGAADGTSIGKNRRMEQLAVMLDQSGDFSVGTGFDTEDMELVSFREISDNMNAAPPLFTGIKDKIPVDADYDLYNQLCFEITDPTPFTLVAIMPQQTTYDRS